MADSPRQPDHEAVFLDSAVERWRAELRDVDARRELLMQKLLAAERLLQLVKDNKPLGPSPPKMDRSGSQPSAY